MAGTHGVAAASLLPVRACLLEMRIEKSKIVQKGFITIKWDLVN